MPYLFLVHMTHLQFYRLPHSRMFYILGNLLLVISISTCFGKIVSGYNVLWKNHYEDSYWSQDIHCNEPQPFEFWLTWTW